MSVTEGAVEKPSGLRRGVEESAACGDAHVGTESTSLLRFCQKRKEGGGRCF